MVVRKRLIFWLIRAYLAKWGKTIFFSFLAGLAVFFLVLYGSRYFINLIPIYKHSITGVMGSYTVDTIPYFISSKLSRGLTAVDKSGTITPDIAKSWEILDEGKTYVFHLKKDQYLSDGRNITSDLISYNFSDVTVERPDKYTIIYKLKDRYAPFLITVSRPMFQSGLVGSGEYKIDDIALNGNFIQSLTLIGVRDKFDVKTYEFYPSVEALKYAYVLGDVTEAVGLDDMTFQDVAYDKFANTRVKKNVNYKKLVTLFYNNNDSVVSDKRIRLGLSYALPNEYTGQQKAFLPYSPVSIFYNKELEDKEQNLEHAKLLLSAATEASDSAKQSKKISLTISTLPKYKSLANNLAKNFAKVDVNTTIEEVDRVPANFQLFLGDFTLSDDPDQYPLWHSGQVTNITKYKNLRIDKLLEDGRNTIELSDRKTIYADFQRFLTDDVPASFLYFPVEYEIARR